MPVDTYKIQLEPIKSAEADASAKKLALEIAQLNNRVGALKKALEKSASIQEKAEKTGGADPKAIRVNIETSKKLDAAAQQLSKSVKYLTNTFKELPKVINDAVTKASVTARGVRTDPGRTVALDPQIKDLTKELVNLRKNVGLSATYQTKKEDVTGAIDKLIRELSVQRRDITKLADSVRGLYKAVGRPEAPRAGELKKPDYSLTTDAKLFGKALKDMGGEFEKIKKELSDKIVVAIDLETSAIDKTLAKKLGKDIATEFVTQIAYQKGTLSEVLAGAKTVKEGTIYIQPPKDITSNKQYLDRLVQAAPTEDIKNKIKEGAIAFDKLKAEGKEAAEAMSMIADVLKDAEAVIGHNIAAFDIKVLEHHLEKAGVKVDAEIDKFVDTLKLARRNFPERYGANKELTKLQPQKLEAFDRDFALAGKSARDMGEKMHDASVDLKVNASLLRALDKSTTELSAAESNVASMLDKLLADMAGATQDAAKKIRYAGEKAGAAAEDYSTLGIEAKKFSKVLSKQIVNVEELASVKSALQTRVYGSTALRPRAEAGRYDVEGTGAAGVSEKVLRIWGDLAKSLFDLQKNMVTSLEKGMNKGLAIWKDASGEAFKLGEGGREWEVKIADVRGLRRELASTFREQATPGATPGQLVKAFKAAFVRREMSTMVSKEDMALDVYKEIGSLNKETLKKVGSIVEDLYKGIQDKTVTEKDIFGRGDLQTLYKEVALEAQAERAIMEKFVKSITLPAAQVTPQGTLSFETKYGAEKAVSNFATITTGFEKMVGELEKLGAPAVEIARFMQDVTKAPLRPAPGTKGEKEATMLAETLQKRILQLGGRDVLKRGYSRAVSLRETERGKSGLEVLRDAEIMSLGELIKKAKELNVTALDAAKALDEISFENFYDILNKMFKSGETPFLERQAGSVIKLGQSERSLRKIGSVINDVMGLLPMVEPGRPKRREYDEQSLRVFTKAMGELKPEEQKQHIIDVGMLWKDLVTRSEKLQEPGIFTGKGYLGKPMASSLDLSDAASSALKQFNLNMTSNLKALDKTMTSMSLSNIRALAPFQQYASIQRQMSYATSAVAGGLSEEKGFTTPGLMSSREKKLVESGRYGAGGYGVDVLTELRNTASTFEDQIVISGRLAKAFTKITDRLVRPAATYLEQQRITEVTGGVQRMTPRAARMKAESEAEYKSILGDVAKQFQEILGVPEKYRGRADIAEISKEIEPIMREHRGIPIEVQTAKLTETFLNYFGRKFSTRFGTKGVSVTPRYGELPEDIKGLKDVSKFIQAGFKTGVAPGPGLGAAKLPLSVGQMVSEIFAEALDSMHTEQVGMDLHNQLIASGNKFVIEMFKDASKGLVTDEEANKQQELFKKAAKAWQDIFGMDLPTGPAGIKEIRGLYEEQTGREPFAMKPIEARISSKGIAKRGLMPELLEGIVNNLIGTTGGVTTLVDKIGKDALTETSEARERLNEYLEALGFEAFKDIDKVIKGLNIPEMDIDELKEWESQWKVYTDVVDEFGKQMQSFVAPKFLQIIEEPHRYKEWSGGEIEKGIKGARLDFQSFAAMAGVFGEGSNMLKELAMSTSLAAKEGWELMRAFQMLDPSMKELKESVMKTLPTVKLEEVKGFEDATGTVEDFKDTLFDIGKYPTPFKLRVPGARGEYEELPVPGAALRGTYREQLLGRGAPTNIARYLANLVNSAKAVEDLTAAAARGGMGLSEDIQRKFASTIRKELTVSLTDAIKQFRGYEAAGALTPQNIEFMQTTIESFKKGLSTERAAPGIYQEGLGRTELEAVEAYQSKAKGKFKYSSILGRISDILIGADPASLQREMEKELLPSLKAFEESGVVPEKFKGRSPEGFKRTIDAYIKRNIARGEAAKAFDIELEAGNLDEFAQKVGIDISESVKQALEQKLESLSRAKISYFRELGTEVFGKKKGIEQVFFQRVTPAVTGKAVSAITDKTKELTALLKTLSEAKYDLDLDIPDIDNIIKSVRALNKEHKEYVDKAKKLGLPVLKEGEIAIPEAQAAKIKVRTGKEGEVESNLADLIKKQEKVFVESIRYPFTGTLSVQPAMAKLMEDMGLNLGKQAIAVPGAPQLDLDKLNRVIGTLREYVGIDPKKELGGETLTLLEQREKAWAEGTEKGAEKAAALTNTIEGLLKVINDATPKFTNLEQKLDFDGDALFVHTGQLEESRKEIADHYRALGSEVTSVRNLFRSLFTTVNEGDVSTLLEMRQVFEKKHPREKGFEFLTKPYISEEMKGLALEDVMGGLFKYTKGAEGLKKGTGEWQKAVADWSKGFVADEILPEVFTKLGVQGPEREAYMSKLPGAKAGIPKETTASNELERRIGKLSEELVRRQLWEKRYADAITGQLYKLHTGQTVEGVSRIARVSEMETGFGSGLAGTGQGAQPSAEFLSAFPKESVALGGRPTQEFATRVNEIMRFVIQKGMDVKHAGVEAVGKTIIANIGKTSGAEIIMKAMEEFKDQFEDLAAFNDQIANEVKLRLGAVSTDELKKELKRFEPDVGVEDLNIDRSAIMKRIIKHVDLQAVFEELFRQIRRQAVKGLSKQLTEEAATLPPGTKRMQLMRDIEAAGGAERLAAKKIEKEAGEKGGISAFKYITTTLQPLYRMRTSMETMATAAARTGIKIDAPDMPLPAGKSGKDLARQYETAAKAANALTKAMEASAGAPGKGIYSSMVVGALEQRYKDLEELQKLDQDAQKYAGKFEYAFTEVMDANKLAAKVWTESKELAGVKAPTLMPADYDVTGWLDQMNQVKHIAARKLEEISERAGLPPMVPEEKQLLASEFETKFGGRSFQAIKDVIGKGMVAREEKIVPEDLEAKAKDAYAKILDFVKFQISFVEQLRRVSEIVKTVPAQKMYLTGAFPDFDPTKELKPSFEKVSDSSKEFFDKEKAVTELLDQYYKEQTTARLGDVQKSIKTMAEPATASAAAEDLKKGALKAADEITEVIDKTVVQRKRDALKYLESKAEGPKPTRGALGVRTEPLFSTFRASGVQAGGGYGGGTQQESIMKEMLGIKDPSMLLESTGFRGQAIHRKIQKEFVGKYPDAEIEQLMEDFENKITGHFDILYEKSGQKILTDIKTVYSTKQFERLREISDEISKRNITIQQKLEELKASDPTSSVEKNVIRRLENYISQVNIYLKNTEGAIGELLIASTFDPEDRVTIPTGKFDPELFAKDVDVINKSKAKVIEILKSISTTGGLPEGLLKEYPKIYKALSKQLEQSGVEGFKKSLPVQTLPMNIGKVGKMGAPAQEVLGRLTDFQQEQFERVSGEYLDIFKELGGPGSGGAEKYYKLWFESGAGAAGAPPAAPPPTPPTGPGGPGGGGFDDDDEFRKKIEELLSRLRGGTEPDVGEMSRLIKALHEAADRSASAFENDNEQLGQALEDLVKRIREVIEMYGGMKHFERVAKLYGELDKIKVTGEPRGAKDFGKFSTADIERVQPDRPEAVHKNLQALYEAAIRVNRLADSEEIQRFGPEIAKLLMEVAEKGPAGISPQISEAISNLPPEKKGGMAKIWMLYKKSVSEYFLRRLDDLKQEIEKEGSSPEGRKAYMEYEQVLEKYLANIRGTIGRMSDIFTTQGPTGKKTQFVDPELARLTGIYKTPKQIEEVVKQGSMMSGEFKPIMDVLVGDLDPTLLDEMAKPIEKVRMAFQMLTKEDAGMRAILGDADAFRRIGHEAVKAWDFNKLVSGITQLRGGLQAYNRLQIGGFGGLGEDYTEQVRKNVEDTIGYLKQLEKMFAPIGAEASPMGTVGVPPFLDPKTQELIHKRNIAQVQKHFAMPETAGGPERGEAFTYRYKIVDPASKQTLSSMAEEFKKIGEETNSAGQQVGVFTQRSEDLIKAFQGKRGIGQAFGRVIRWGFASRTVYGMISALQGMVNTIADVESGIAILRQVMSPLQTNFDQITVSALDFAKQFGLPIRQVIDSMRVFAQQGLAQQEVVDRTRTSMLAANVTTLSTTEATEAITAAMKVYGKEGQSTLQFLDAWAEVEAKHAITSGDLANALKKAAAVAKTSGVSFDQLNAIITGIGETSRQTGKEIGTSLRFMFRRIQADKAPKQLAQIGVPVVTGTGELKSTFDILDQLAGKWDELSNAQRLNIATAIGGRRHYNSLLILMDHWNDVLDTLGDSLNSKGAAERRNAIVMETYAKKLQQVRAAMAELQVQFGKFALPFAKTILTGLKGVLEIIANISPGLKIAALGFSALFVIIAKGQNLISGVIDKIKGFSSAFGDVGTQFMKQFKIGIFETFGKLPKGLEGIDIRGLSSIGQAGKGIQDFESVIGKAAFSLAKFGKGWNAVMSEIAYSGTVTSESVSKAFGKIAGGLGTAAIKTAVKQPVIAGILEVMAKGAESGEAGFQKLGQMLGIPAEGLAKWSLENANFVKSVAPMAGSIAALIPVAGVAGDQFKKLAFSAAGYEKSLSPLRRKLSSELATINELSQGYRRLNSDIKSAAKASEPEAVKTAIRREEYVSPVLTMGKTYENARKFGNQLAKTNMSMIQGFDSLGNAVLKTTSNFEDYFRVLRAAKLKELADAGVSALEKYAEELTNAGTMGSRFRSELKKFVEEVPALGPLLAKQIQVSPAQELDEATKAVNQILSAREEFPMTTAFDDLFQRYLGDLEKVRTRYNEFYGDFKRVLADLPTEGLSAAQIAEILDKESLKPAFELMLEFEGRLKGLAKSGKIDWEDILGTEILRRVHPEVSLDYAAPLTKEMLRQNKIIQRESEAFAGDIVLFGEGVDDIAGKQGILKYREGLGYFVEAIDKELRTVREIPFDTVRQFVDSVFPAHKMADQMQENIDILRESLIGAAAGMVGIADKEFRRVHGLGPRFFEQIPTETLIQTPAGFGGLGGGFGAQPFKAGLGGIGFENIIKDYFIKPMKELEYLVEEPKKRLEAGRGFDPGFEEEIERYGTIIKNNQVVVQYMALFADLNKALAESARMLEENIAVEKVRNETLSETSGLLRGFPANLADVNLGVRDFFQLTAQQRMLVKERALPTERREFNALRTRVGTETIRRQAFAGEEERIRRAIVQMGFIRRQAEAAGVTIPREDLMSMTEAVAAGSSPLEGAKLAVQKGIKSDTAAMVTGINDLVDATDPSKAAARAKMEIASIGKSIAGNIELMKDPRSIDKLNTAFGMDYLEIGIKKQFDRLAKLRNYHETKGNASVVKSIDQTMTESSRSLISALGVRGATGIISPDLIPTPQQLITKGAYKLQEPGKDITSYMPGEFTVGNLISRALGGEGLREFRQRIQETSEVVTPGERTSAKVIRGLAPALTPLIGPLGYALARSEATSLEAGSYGRVKGSPEFKKLSTLMDDQKKISVTDSKTLTKLFFGYTAFNTIAKRASEREERAYQVQIDQLKQQRSGIVVKYKEGELDKSDFNSQIKEINAEIISLVREAKEAAATTKERATQEAIGVIAGASTVFASSLGISEKAIEGLGGTAAASIVAWNAWTALTGEKLPDAVQKATDAAKKWGDTLGEEGVTWLDKVKIWLSRNTLVGKFAPGVFGAAGAAAGATRDAEEAAKAQKSMFTEQEKEKIKRLKDFDASTENVKKADNLLNSVKSGDIKKLGKDEKLFKVNSDQLTTLLAIEENTKQSAEKSEEGVKEKEPLKYIGKELRTKLDEIKQERLAAGGDTATRLKDLLAAAVLVASGGYLHEKGRVGRELGEATRRAEKINVAFEDLVNKFPKEVESLIQTMQTRRSEMTEAAGDTGVETVRKSLLLDTSKFYDEFLNKLLELAERAKSEADKSGKIIESAKDKMYLKQTGAEIAASISDFAKSIIEASIDMETGLKLRTETAGAMKGLPIFEEISMGKMPHELTATERLMKEGGPAWQNMYKTFKNLDNVRESLIGLVQTQAKGIVNTQVGLWADTLDQQGVIKDKRKDIEKASASLVGKTEDPTFVKATVKMREVVEYYNKAIDPSMMAREISAKKSDLRMFKQSSKKLAAQYRESLRPPDVADFAKSFQEFSRYQEKVERPETEATALELSRTNKKVIQLREQIKALQGLSTEIGNTKLGKAATELSTKITETMEKLRMQVDVYRDLEGATKTVTELMTQLHEVLATGLNVQQLIGDFERMKSSFTLDELQQQFVEAADVFEQIRRGGAAPNAPVWPTFEMMQAGMSPGQMATATRSDAALAAIVAQGRMPTGEELQKIEFDDRLRERQYQQAKEDDKLNRQRSAAATFHRGILEAQQRAGMLEGDENSEMRKALISRFEEIRTNLIKQAAIAGETRREISPGVYERYGYDFGDIETGLNKIGEDFGEQGVELVKGIGGVEDVMNTLGTYSPVVKELIIANNYLKGIAENTAKSPGIVGSLKELFKPMEVPEISDDLRQIFQGGSAGKLSGAGGGFDRSAFSKLLESALSRHPFTAPFMGIFGDRQTGGFQIGGAITGQGGPKDDRVPIWASPGEFVVKASSAKRLGNTALEYMNQTGSLPGFAEGGEVPEWASKHPNLYGLFGAGKAAGQALVGSAKDIGHMVTDPFVDIYKGQGNYAANLAYAAMSVFPEAKGTLMGLGQVIKGPLGQKATQQLIKQSGKYLKTRTASIAAKSTAKPAKAVFDAAKQDEAILATLRLNRQYKEIQDATGLSAKFKTEQFVDLLSGSKRVNTSEKALSEAIDQLGVVANKVGAKNLNITEIGAASLENPGAFAEFITPRILRSKQGILRFNKDQWRDPRNITEAFKASRMGRDMGMGGQFADVDPMEAFRYAITHEAGHAYTTIPEKIAAPASVGLRKSITQSFVRGNIKKPVSMYAEENASETMAETFASAFHTDARKATQEVLDLRKSLGIGLGDDIAKIVMKTERGATNLGYALGAKAVKEPKVLGSMTKVHKNLEKAYEASLAADNFDQAAQIGAKLQGLREGQEFAKVILAVKAGKEAPVTSATPAALKYLEEGFLSNMPKLGFAGGGLIENLKEMWAKFIGQASPEGETTSAAEALRRVKEREQKIKEAVESKGMGGMIRRKYPEGGIVEDLKGLWEKVIGRATPEGDTTSAAEALRRMKEREQKIKDAVEEKGMGGMIRRKYPEGGAVEDFKDMWEKVVGRAAPEGDTASAAEALRRVKEREKKQKDTIKQIFDEKQNGGWIDDLRNILQGGVEGAKGTYKNIVKAFTSPEGTIEREALTGELTKKRVEEALGEKLTSYSQGTPFVPQTQLAMVHQGEAIIPAEYNTGGFIGAPKFQAGGAVNPLKVVEDAGEKIGEAIVKKIEQADITLNVPDSSDIPALEIGNLDELRTILEGGSVGADRTSKLDQFIDTATNKLDRLEDRTVDNTERITMVEAQTSDVLEIGDLKLSISDLEAKVDDVYTVIENKIDSDRDNSYMEARLHEVVSDLKTDDLLPIRSNVSRLELVINDLMRDINNQYDILYSNINRMDLK